jgi:hypothetical protein
MSYHRAAMGVYCDYCKYQFGKLKGNWHPKAMTQAVVTAVSESKRARGLTRSYCQACLDIVQQGDGNSKFTLPAQLLLGKELADVRLN